MMKNAVAESKRRYQSLLHDFLELQKEFVMKKKRCEALKNKRDTLMAEVRFLRRKHSQLVRMQSSNKEGCDNQVRANEQLVGKTYLTSEIHPILASIIQEKRSQGSASLPPRKKFKTCSTKGKTKEKNINDKVKSP